MAESENSSNQCQFCLRFLPYGVEKGGKCRVRNIEVSADHTCEDFAREVEVRHATEGWTLLCGRHIAGPFRFLDEVDHTSLAEQFGVHPKEVWKAKISVYSYQTRPKMLERQDIIELEDKTIQPSFERLSVKVHPAIGVVDGRGYVGVTLPCVVAEKTKEGETKESAEQELLFLISSAKEMISTDRKALTKLGWRLAYRPTTFENRWALRSVEGFLNGTLTVDPAKVYSEIREAWQSYIEFDDSTYYDLIVLWCVGTYFFHLFNTYPYIYLGGVKRTGKTKALTLASALCFNSIFSGNVSTASIFRLIQSGRCSLLMDETEKLSNPERAQDFRSLLLSGYKRGGLVYRTEKTRREKHIPEAFEVYSPKMLANIQGIEDVLEDRCITIIMKRAKNRDVLNREVDINDPFWQEIRNHLYILFLTYWKDILEIYQSFSAVCEVSAVCVVTENTLSELSGRELELWKPIFAIAKFFDKYVSVYTQTAQSTQTTLTQLMFALAKRKSEEKRIENMTETGDYILIETLLVLVTEDRYYKVREIRDAMASHFDEEQKWLNSKWLGRALKRLGFVDKRRVGTGYEYRLSKHTIEDLASRLGIERGPQTVLEKMQLVLDCVVRLQGEYGASKIQIADELQDRIPREETLQLIDKLTEEGTVFRVNSEHIKKT